jgi:hypothetical protein
MEDPEKGYGTKVFERAQLTLFAFLSSREMICHFLICCDFLPVAWVLKESHSTSLHSPIFTATLGGHMNTNLATNEEDPGLVVFRKEDSLIVSALKSNGLALVAHLCYSRLSFGFSAQVYMCI